MFINETTAVIIPFVSASVVLESEIKVYTSHAILVMYTINFRFLFIFALSRLPAVFVISIR